MTVNAQILSEIELLNMFDLASMRQGLKIHHEAEGNIIAAGQRLYDKGITTQPDGGYLTDRGLEAAELAQKLTGLLNFQQPE